MFLFFVIILFWKKVLSSIYRREPYGIAFPTDSSLREIVNVAILSVIESSEYDEIAKKSGFQRDGGSAVLASADSGSSLSWDEPGSIVVVIITAVIVLFHAAILMVCVFFLSLSSDD